MNLGVWYKWKRMLLNEHYEDIIKDENWPLIRELKIELVLYASMQESVPLW